MTTPDPNRPAVPLKHDLGRVTTHGVLLPHWGCRWCHCTLTARGWSLMCDRCDRA